MEQKRSGAGRKELAEITTNNGPHKKGQISALTARPEKDTKNGKTIRKKQKTGRDWNCWGNQKGRGTQLGKHHQMRGKDN